MCVCVCVCLCVCVCVCVYMLFKLMIFFRNNVWFGQANLSFVGTVRQFVHSEMLFSVSLGKRKKNVNLVHLRVKFWTSEHDLSPRNQTCQETNYNHISPAIIQEVESPGASFPAHASFCIFKSLHKKRPCTFKELECISNHVACVPVSRERETQRLYLHQPSGTHQPSPTHKLFLHEVRL